MPINRYFDYGTLLRDPELEENGSNFVDWYERLRNILIAEDVLFVIEEPVGEPPGDFVSATEYDEYADRLDTYIEV